MRYIYTRKEKESKKGKIKKEEEAKVGGSKGRGESDEALVFASNLGSNQQVWKL